MNLNGEMSKCAFASLLSRLAHNSTNEPDVQFNSVQFRS
jgi:hypothetical protein